MNNTTPNVVYNNQTPQNHLQVGTPAQTETDSVQIVTSKDTNSVSGGSSPFNVHHRRYFCAFNSKLILFKNLDRGLCVNERALTKD